MRSTRLIRCLPWLSAGLLTASCAAQAMGHPGTLPGQAPAREPVHHQASRGPANAGPAAVSTGSVKGPDTKSPVPGPDLPPSLMDKPAQPAKITLQNGVLTIRADNSSLSAILHQLASSGGMIVDGFEKDQRVFGVYGPGDPRDVLSGLLQGAGYNFLMVGATRDGTPKQIVLTAQTGGGVTSGPAQAGSDDQADDDNSNNSSNFPEEPPTPERPAPIPGASTTPPNSPDRVKTPAEIIQELQRLRQQQQNPQ